MATYRIDRSYDWNYEHGPSYSGPFPRIPETPVKDFFGIPVRSRIGIAAGILLNARWIRLYSRLGFDILTYKTVRIRRRACHPLPNWIYLEGGHPLDPRRGGEAMVRRRGRPRDPAAVPSSVSFGMPSKDPEVWMEDAARARRALRPGQALVVSVVASPGPGDGAGEIAAEFGRLAAMAREAGAQVIEANLSCPNVRSAEGDLYLDPERSRQVAREMRRAAGSTPVTLKAGFFPEPRRLRALLRAVDGLADGMVLVNGISRRIVDADGSPAFGPGRERAGVLGRSIHEPCLMNVRAAVQAIAEDRLALRVAAVGGVLSSEDAVRYFDAGAAAVLMGGAPMFDPLLAIRFKAAHPDW